VNTLLSNILLAITLVLPAFANAAAPKHGFSQEQSAVMAQANSQIAAEDFISSLFTNLVSDTKNIATETIPYAEYSEAGYVIFSDDTEFNSGIAKKKMAQELPADMTLVVFTGSSSKSYQKSLFEEYAEYIDSSRLKVVYLPGGANGFWARDGVPVPVWKMNASGQYEFNVVDARYYHGFEADEEVSELFGAGLLEHDYYYEGGNYAANSKGDCIVVNNERVVKIPDSIFNKNYGCKTLVRLPHTKGIGHIDESVKFMDDDTLLVDDADYAKTLKAKGFDVVKMVRPSNDYETYVNALVVNGTAFLPVFSQKTDIQAIEMYESFGLKVVPLNSISLSNDGLGSIHCITMSYPKVPFNELLKHIGAKDIK
jgi:hypothetical protein